MLIPFGYWVFLSLVGLQRLSEIFISKKHATWIISQGGREFGASQFKWVLLLMIGFFVGLPLEAFLLKRTLVFYWPLLMLIFLLAQALRYWAMWSLGKFWNVRIWILPKAPRIRQGPYKYFSHPNYVAVVLELICVPLMVQCWITAMLSGLGFLWFLSKRIPEENRALSRLELS